MAITQNEPISLSNTIQPIKVIPTTDVASSVKTGTSVIAPNPVDSIQKATPTVNAITTPTPTPVYATSAEIERARPIVIAIPSVISDTVKAVTGSPKVGGMLGGGGGGGGASSEEGEKGGDIEEPKKPNYLILGLIGVGAYFLFKKFK